MFVEVDAQKTKYMYYQEETGKKSGTNQKTVSRNCFVFGFVYFVCFFFSFVSRNRKKITKHNT